MYIYIYVSIYIYMRYVSVGVAVAVGVGDEFGSQRFLEGLAVIEVYINPKP